MNPHLSQLKTALKNESIQALLISSIPNIIYLTGFSGFSKEDRDAYLLITETEQYIFTHSIYQEVAEKEMSDFQLVKMSRENPISESLKNLVKKHQIIKLGYEDFDLTVAEYHKLLKYVNKEILEPSNLVHQMRKIKTKDEIKAIHAACQLGDKAFTYIQQCISDDITEKQLATQLDLFIKTNGAEISFPSIVAFGSNASRPHHVPTDKKIEKDNVVLLDFGVRVNNYCSDMTRTIFFGESNNEQKKIYETVLGSQQAAITYIEKQLTEGKKIKASDADKTVREYIIKKGYPSIPHSLGHGIGLEVHEEPRLSINSKDILTEGMVFSIEPGIYTPEFTGVRIEDLFVIEENKLNQLTQSSKDLITN